MTIHRASFLIIIPLVLSGCGKVSSESAALPAVLSAASVLMNSEAVAAGAAVEGAVVLTLAPGWHTYSDPPGDSGMPPIVEFSLPSGWSAERLPLPPPQRFEDPSGVTFGYEGELRIGFRITAPPDAVAGEMIEIGIDVQWLICRDVCLPRSAQLKALLGVKEP
jgi:thiol:disulfide interchange protein DsbD